MLGRTTAVVAALIANVVGAQVPIDSVRSLAAINRDFVRLGQRYGDAIWPGFRPDTIPVAYVFPEQGTALFNWRGPLPSGYAQLSEVPGVGWLSRRNVT